MKRSLIFSLAALSFVMASAGSASAAFVYYDVASNAAQGVSVTTNTFRTSNYTPPDPFVASPSDGALANTDSWSTFGATAGTDTNNLWRFRNTGPGAPAFGASAFTGFYNVAVNLADPAIYTTITGLVAGQQYKVRVYGIFPNNATSRHGADFSISNGTSTTTTHISNINSPVTWVDNSNGGLGADIGARGTSDTRFFLEINGTLAADALGNARIDLTIPALVSGGVGATDRFHLDGYAVEVVPEPSVAALGGLGLFGLLLRRRK